MYHAGLTIGGLATGNLPVTIVSFSALANNNTIQTNWHTATELGVSSFDVQRSNNGNSYKTIGTVNAIGQGANNYQFTDLSPINGINYYRLQSIDKDGNLSYSKTISVQVLAGNQLSVYPNPCSRTITVNGNHITSIQIFNNLGRLMSTHTLKDENTPSIKVSNLQSGTYHIRTQSIDGSVRIASFIKE